MLGLSEMTDDERVNLLTGAVGKKQHGQPGHSQKHDKSLNLEQLRSAEAPHDLRQHADDEEVPADNEDRQR